MAGVRASADRMRSEAGADGMEQLFERRLTDPCEMMDEVGAYRRRVVVRISIVSDIHGLMTWTKS
jgi:hypothetical protein